MGNTNTSSTIGKVAAFLLEVLLYVALYTVASSFLFRNDQTDTNWVASQHFLWYSFFVISAFSNMFKPLLYLQLLAWAIVCQFMYNNDHAWQSITIVSSGLVAMAANILIRIYLQRRGKNEKQ